MFPSPIGASTGGVQPSVPVQKASAPEEFPETQPAQSNKSAENNGQPPVPGNSGVPISVEAITALQQVEETASADGRQEVRNAHEGGTKDAARLTDAAETHQIVQTSIEREAVQSVQNREQEVADVPAGEETDTAGRSVRNPLDLQI